jgi:hypothetical protein
MSRFSLWIKTSIPAVALVGIWELLTVLYGTNEAFHDAVFKTFNRLSIPTQEILVGLVIPIAVAITSWKNRPIG